MKFSGKTIGLVAGAAATLMCLEPVTLSGKGLTLGQQKLNASMHNCKEREFLPLINA